MIPVTSFKMMTDSKIQSAFIYGWLFWMRGEGVVPFVRWHPPFSNALLNWLVWLKNNQAASKSLRQWLGNWEKFIKFAGSFIPGVPGFDSVDLWKYKHVVRWIISTLIWIFKSQMAIHSMPWLPNQWLSSHSGRVAGSPVTKLHRRRKTKEDAVQKGCDLNLRRFS